MDALTRWYNYARQRQGFPTPRQMRRGRQKARQAGDWNGQLLFWVQQTMPPGLTKT